MAPTKNVADTPQKVVKKRVPKMKPTKPCLKIPKCITAKNTKLEPKPPRITRKVSNQKKIELANEVALQQLTKPSETPKPPSPAKKPVNSLECSKIKPTLNRKRKHTPILAPEESDLENTPLANTVTKSNASVGPKRIRKRSLKSSEENNLVTSSISLYKKTKPVTKVTSDDSDLELSLITPSVTRTKNSPRKKKDQKVIPDLISNKPNNKEEITSPKETPKTPVKKVKKSTPKKLQIETKDPTTKDLKEKPTKKKLGRPKGPQVAKEKKAKGITNKKIKSAASLLENTLMNHSAVKVHSRSASVNSSVSNLSWTKDISSFSSDTTTCVTVTSSDFVRFDNKLPIVQVENADYGKLKVINRTLLENVSSSTTGSKSSKPSSPSAYDDSVGNPGLNLSTSSLTGESRPDGFLTNTELMCLEFEEVTRSLNLFYPEIGKWGLIESDDEDYDILSNISETTKVIGHLNSFLDDDVLSINKNASLENVEPIREVINQKEISDRNELECCRESAEYSSPIRTSCEKQNSDDEFSVPCYLSPTTNKRVKFPKNIPDNFAVPTTLQKNVPEGVARSSGSSETFTSDNYNYVSFEEKVCDDEDALSLFAESISGMESSRLSSVASVQDPNITKPTPYIPEPRQRLLLQKYTYRPTRINAPQNIGENVLPIRQPDMIEKHNADSSSICKEADNAKNTSAVIKQPSQLWSPRIESSPAAIETTHPMRLFARYQPVNAIKSSLYKNHCFFYLATQCKNIICRFPHSDIDPIVLKSRLVVLNEDNLIEEYLLTCKHPNLRRIYCLAIMRECDRRAATRLLLEMAIDLGLGVVEREDHALNVNALEITLLHLNKINFDVCEDLLTFTHNGTTMCDSLLVCMANSQNFAQFKGAFVKLSNFMAQIKRSVDIETASNILERVCILPCEKNLVKGMLCLMKNTDPRIFNSAMTQVFEVQLSNVESDVVMPYWTAKKEAMDASQSLKPIELTPIVSRVEPRRMSPDTTNLDNLKKPQMVPQTTFKRTINTAAISHLFKSPSHPAPKQRYTIHNTWHAHRGYTHAGQRTRMSTGHKSLWDPN